jgi:hypothetical protein
LSHLASAYKSKNGFLVAQETSTTHHIVLQETVREAGVAQFLATELQAAKDEIDGLISLGAVYCGQSERDRHGVYSLVDYGYGCIAERSMLADVA